MRAGRYREDAGQVTTGLLVVMVVAVLAVLLKALVPLMAATDQRSRAQTASDAAALAAVDALGEQVRDKLRPGHAFGWAGRDLEPLFACGRGRQAARDYADRNGADLLEPTFDCGRRGERTAVRLEVRTSDQLAGGQQSDSVAVGQFALVERPCRLSDDPDDLIAAYQAALAAIASASSAVEAAEQAAEDAQEAVEEALEQVQAGDLDPEVARDLIETAQEAAQDAADAVQDAVADVPSPPDAVARLDADCGPLQIGLRLELDTGTLTPYKTTPSGGDLDDLLEPRLISERVAV